jgi:hypothetical protein
MNKESLEYKVEVSRITRSGLTLLVNEKEYFLSYSQFPWFLRARVNDIFQVDMKGSEHIRWENLDIDLSIPIIENPENYPLISK